MNAYNFLRSGRNFTIFFVQRRKDPSRQRCLDFVAFFIFLKIFAHKVKSCRNTY